MAQEYKKLIIKQTLTIQYRKSINNPSSLKTSHKKELFGQPDFIRTLEPHHIYSNLIPGKNNFLQGQFTLEDYLYNLKRSLLYQTLMVILRIKEYLVELQTAEENKGKNESEHEINFSFVVLLVAK